VCVCVRARARLFVSVTLIVLQYYWNFLYRNTEIYMILLEIS